jgi:hypothetical protein
MSNKISFAIFALLITAVLAKPEDPNAKYEGGFSCCPDTYVYDNDTLSCICPPATPYINLTGQCTACKTPFYWNNSSSLCLACPLNQIYNSSSGICQCAAIDKFLNIDGTCISCPYPNFWDVNTSQCY